MKWKTPPFILILILTVLLGGCLPSVPKKITGPTWTTKYWIPVINQKQISFGPETEEEDGLGLEDVRINYESSSEVDGPTKFNLFDESILVDPGSIPALGFSGTLPVSGGHTLPGSDEIRFSFSGLDKYVTATLSNEDTNYNYIEVNLENATA